MNPFRKLFGRPAPTSPTIASVVHEDGMVIAEAPVTLSVSPIVTIFNLFNAFPALLGQPASVSLRAGEEADIGQVELQDGDTIYVRYMRTDRATLINLSDGHEYVTVTIK